MVPTSLPLIGDEQRAGCFYTGEWAAAKRTSDVVEPASGARLGVVGQASPDDIACAARSCRTAQGAWSRQSPDARAALFAEVVRLANEHRGEIVEWIIRESGSVRAKAEFELAVTIKALHLAGAMPHQAQGLILPSEPGRLSFAKRRPLGVVGVISPFNFPLYLAMRAVAPALAVGNAVLLKPDPRTAICGGFLIARLFELAGLASGTLQVLPGGADAGEALCRDPNVAAIQFTGSTAAGRRVGELAGASLKKVSLELGGKNALIVLEDADLDLAVSNAAWASYLHQGQICMASGRILVHTSRIDEVARMLAETAQRLNVGDPMSGIAAVGPMINTQQGDRAKSIIDRSVDMGASLLAGGSLDRAFLSPAVLTNVTRDMPAFQEEVFAPVAILVPFDTVEEAVQLANETAYGLSGAIITKDIGRGMAIGAQLEVGLLHINDQTVNDDVVNPFGGVGASGNGSSIGGPANWELFTHWQWTTIKAEAPAFPI